MELTEGTLLGGRVAYCQPGSGFRTGIEPVLLAASIRARPADRVLEAGTGAGAGLLCLLSRLPGLYAAGVEQDAPLAELARANLAANGMHSASVAVTDITSMPAGQPFDHAMANPPWHAWHGTASGDPGRDAAKRAAPNLLAAWAEALARQLRPGGSLTFILPAASIGAAMEAFAAACCGQAALLPFWPRAGRPARLVLVRALKARQGAGSILPGVTLHEGEGYTPQAHRILWGGEALPWE